MVGGAARTQARAPDAAGGASRAPSPPLPAHPRLIDVGNRLPSLWEIRVGGVETGEIFDERLERVESSTIDSSRCFYMS